MRERLSSFARRLIAAAALSLVSIIVVQAPALAAFDSTPAAPSMTVSSATLASPTGVGAVNTNCVVLGSTKVKATWTATTSAFADGYRVLRSTTNGGPYSLVGTVSGLNTTSFTDSSVSFSTTYYYVAQATKVNWTSGNSTQVSITTPSSLCVV
jgi:hypothetical protein